MYTQVGFEELVKQTLARVGSILGAQFEKPSAAEIMSYPHGKWLYETDGPAPMAVEVYRAGASERRGIVFSWHVGEDKANYERRLETELLAVALKLISLDEHDDQCAGCNYELRRTLNDIGVRIRDYRVTCAQCGTEVIGELEHHVHGKSYCVACLGLLPSA